MDSLARKFLGICLLFAVMLSGCALTDAHVDLAYLPEPARKSPLGTIRPMTVSVQVEDQRPAGERSWVGNKRNTYGMVTAWVKSNKEATAVVEDAVKGELINNGHTIVDAKENPSDVGIFVALKRYWGDIRIHFWDIEVIGTLEVDVNIRDRQESLVSKPIVSTFRDSYQIVTDEAYRSVLNGALAEFVRSFSRDPGIIKALKDASSQEEESKTESSPE